MKKRIIVISLILWGILGYSFNVNGQATVEKSDPESFSMILLGDPQNYIKYDINQGIFELMTAWIANNKEKLDINMVLCTGDMVEQNNILFSDGKNGNQSSEQQWNAVSHAFERLDHTLPYVLTTGNHDYGYRSSENRSTQMNHYFPVKRNSCWQKSLVAVCNNVEGFPSLENAAYECQGEKWGKLLIISLEFAPRTEVLEWAAALCNQTKFKNHKVIILTHSYLNCAGNRIKSEKYAISPANYGETIWEKLIYPTQNIRLVLCGHAAQIGDFEKNVSFRTDKNKAEKSVAQMMFNGQTLGGGWQGNGGDGWLRILEFMPDGKTIKVRTFSPFFAISPTTAQYAWRTEAYDQFDIILE